MFALGLVGGAVSCTGQEDLTGTLSVNLIGQAPSGAIYRLRHAVTSVTGGGATRIWNTEDAPDQTSLSDDVAVGNYEVSVAPGWDLELIEGDTTTPVAAQLISDNPASFTVGVHQRTTVPLVFHVDTEVVDLAQGYEIVVTVDEPSPQLVVVTNLNNFQSGSITVFAANADGDAAPLRTIAGPLTRLDFPLGVAVTEDEIVVCDDGGVLFFPLLADGDVAPTRQIIGDDAELGGGCEDVAVVGDDLYVVTSFDVLVFPRTANGDARPRARARSSGRGFFGYIAIDQGELYLSDWNAGKVLVYSLPMDEDAAPVRFISTRCPSGLAVQDGELMVADGCAPGITVYSADASGAAEPLRTLSGAHTGILGSGALRRVQGNIYVTDIEDRVSIFADTAAGDTAPLRVIAGPHTGVVTPVGVAVR